MLLFVLSWHCRLFHPIARFWRRVGISVRTVIPSCLAQSETRARPVFAKAPERGRRLTEEKESNGIGQPDEAQSGKIGQPHHIHSRDWLSFQSDVR
jgi:hypothetical protein